MLIFRTKKEAALILIYLVGLALGAVTTFFSAGGITEDSLGRVLGVWLLTALVFQIALVTRMDLIENGIGYDRLTNWHSFNGKLIGVLIFLHPLWMLWPQIERGEYAFILSYLTNNLGGLLGIAAVALILIQVAVTVLWKSLDYQIWRKTHLIGYPIVVFGFFHVFTFGSISTIPPQSPMSYWMIFLAVIATISMFYSLVYRRIWKHKDFEVVDVEKEAKDVTTVELEPVEEDIDHQPGQFAYVRFDSENVSNEEHHFTISSGAGRKGISFTIKDVGDFTSQIDKLDEGETAQVEGPYGRFTNEDLDGPFTFIAGGIGITPLMSMIRTMNNSESQDRTTLIYGNRTVEDIAFRDELAELGKNDWLQVKHVLSDETREGFRSGFIDKEVLEDLLVEDSEIFLCGPPPMMDAVLETLDELNVDRSRIHLEKFSLRE